MFITLGVLFDFADVVADSVCGNVKQEVCFLQCLFGMPLGKSLNIRSSLELHEGVGFQHCLDGIGSLEVSQMVDEHSIRIDISHCLNDALHVLLAEPRITLHCASCLNANHCFLFCWELDPPTASKPP